MSPDPLATIPTPDIDPIPSIALGLLDQFGIFDPSTGHRARWETVTAALRVELAKHGLLPAESDTRSERLKP